MDAPEKAAPIPADVLAPFRRMAECTEHTDVRDGEIVMRLQHPETKAWVVLTRADFRAILNDRASQEERIREDERAALALTDGELPNLPHLAFDGAFSAIQMRWYARTAVMADRARLRGDAS